MSCSESFNVIHFDLSQAQATTRQGKKSEDYAEESPKGKIIV